MEPEHAPPSGGADASVVPSRRLIALSPVSGSLERRTMGKKKGIPGLSFSWKRATGLSNMKSQISRKTGVPFSRSARQQKVGKAMGCCAPALAMLGAFGVALYSLARVTA